VDVRQSDLTFTEEETADFLRRVMGLDLSSADIATLNRRTEGWIAGLQLAALSMRDSDDLQGLVASFAGSHRYILDYLVEEVFRQQSPDLQDFLLPERYEDWRHPDPDQPTQLDSRVWRLTLRD